jgi:hypothetical protein
MAAHTAISMQKNGCVKNTTWPIYSYRCALGHGAAAAVHPLLYTSASVSFSANINISLQMASLTNLARCNCMPVLSNGHRDVYVQYREKDG